jgi:superfamily II DNA helicase RecQ
MGAYLTVSLIVSLAMAAMTTGLNINSLSIAAKNQDLRHLINSIISAVNNQINKGRLSFNKILSLLQSKNQNALMNYLMNNPVISRNLEGIQHDSDLIASLQAEQQALEAEISSLMNELNSLGYSQSQSGTGKESKAAEEKRKALEAAQAKYDELVNKAENVRISTTNPVTTYTSDIDARSQNINGGLNNNG